MTLSLFLSYVTARMEDNGIVTHRGRISEITSRYTFICYVFLQQKSLIVVTVALSQLNIKAVLTVVTVVGIYWSIHVGLGCCWTLHIKMNGTFLT